MLKNKNCCLVKPRRDRVCYFCGSKIEKGTECLSVNPLRSARRWLCLDCIDDMNSEDPFLGNYSWDDGYSSNGL